MEIETKNASIDTMAVTIRALHVSGKQMTLTVFRQLPVRDAYADDGSLDAELEHWGLVRYDIRDQGSLWLVASSQGKLYRCDADHHLGAVDCRTVRLNGFKTTLTNYIAWERAMVAYQAWAQDEDRSELECPGHPGYLHGFDRVGKRAEYEDIVDAATTELNKARLAAESYLVLIALPQLFIAV